MSISARDRKILAVLIVLALVAAYWFMVLGPKREEASQAAQELTEQEERRDAALATLADLESARRTFETDYASVVRLGKAVPADVDVPSLMIQLEDAAEGAGVAFDSISVGELTPIASTVPPPSAAPPADDAEPAAESGGEDAQTAPGEAAETANETADDASARAENAEGGTAPAPTSSSGSTAPSSGTTPSPAGSETATTSGTAAVAAPSLEGVALTFSFEGDFFHLADFFHELKRFVNVRGGGIEVDGRLMTIDSLSLTPSEKGSGLTAEVGATAYMAPAEQGVTAGATPAGPTTPASPSAQPAGDSTEAPAAPPPATGTAATSGVTP